MNICFGKRQRGGIMHFMDAIDIGDPWAAAGAGGRGRPGDPGQLGGGPRPRNGAAIALRAEIGLKVELTP